LTRPLASRRPITYPPSSPITTTPQPITYPAPHPSPPPSSPITTPPSAQVGLAPSIFLVRAKSGAPIVAIAVITVLVALLVSMSFAEILAVNNFFFAAAAALEALAFIRLRTEQPELPRPWSIPLSNRAASVFVAPQLLICAVVCVLALAKSALTACLCMGVLVLCLGVGVAHRHWLRRMGMRPAQQAAFAGGTPAPK
jgi:amino acid transporter